MWVIPTLLLALIAVAAIEHLHWMHTNAQEVVIGMLYQRDRLNHFNTLLMLEQMIALAEFLYERTSEVGVSYPVQTRRNVALAIGMARRVIYDQVGASNVQEPGQGAWPFNAEGKVDL